MLSIGNRIDFLLWRLGRWERDRDVFFKEIEYFESLRIFVPFFACFD
jgi:hypothetical protein